MTTENICGSEEAIQRHHKDNKTYSIKADRELFCRLVVITRRREIDLENIFTYDLASVPLSLAKLDGSLNKTAKSKLLQELDRHGSNPLFHLRKSSPHG